MTQNNIDISVVVVNHNSINVLDDLLHSIQLSKTDLKVEVIVIDNHSTDNSVQTIHDKYPHVHLIENKENRGFGSACNQGMRASQSNYIFLLNSDTELEPDTFQQIQNQIIHSEDDARAGIFGFRLLNPDRSLQYSFGKFPTILSTVFDIFKPPEKRKVQTKNYEFRHEVDWVTGACILIRRQLIDEIGYFDENYFMYYEETDYCLQAKQRNWKVIFEPAVSVIHKHPHALKKETIPLKIATEIRLSHLYFFRKNRNYISFVLLFYATMIILFVKLLTDQAGRSRTRSIIGSVRNRYKQLRSANWREIR